MRILISPAKKMRVDTDSFAAPSLPAFLSETERLLTALRAMTPAQLQKLWKCNDSIAALNQARLETMDLHRQLTPAILSYEGIQYQYMAPGVFDRQALDYVSAHLRILSGFYGMLRPFDGVTPYRLEMAAPLSVDGAKDLYAFWGDKLAHTLAAETDLVVNLASKEYSKAVLPHLPAHVQVLTCTFGELKGDKVVEKGTMCKMARGEMVRWMAEHDVQQAEALQAFDRLGYRFSPAHSRAEHYVYLKEDV